MPGISILIPPFLVAGFAGWLQHNNFPKWFNALIAFVVIVVVAVVWSLVTNQLVGGSLWSSIAIVVALCAALCAGPLAPLQQWLTTKAPSPLYALYALSRPWQPMMTPVPPRASLQPSRLPAGMTLPIYHREDEEESADPSLHA